MWGGVKGPGSVGCGEGLGRSGSLCHVLWWGAGQLASGAHRPSMLSTVNQGLRCSYKKLKAVLIFVSFSGRFSSAG